MSKLYKYLINYKIGIFLLISLFSLIYFGTLGNRPLANPDEGRYIEIPREIIETANWVTPRLNGILYFEKPPLAYWLNALSIKFLKQSLWTMRFPNALFGFLTVLAAGFASAFLFGRRSVGIWTGIVLGTSTIFFGMSQIVTLDMTMTAFLTFALLCFLLYIKLRAKEKFECEQRTKVEKQSFIQKHGQRLLIYGFFSGMAFATLAKGLVGFLIPIAIIFLWMLLFNQWKFLRRSYLFSGTIVFLLITIPWHIMIIKEQPSFAWFYFIHEHFIRYLTNTHSREQPFYFFIFTFIIGVFPWIFFLGNAWVGILKEKIIGLDEKIDCEIKNEPSYIFSLKKLSKVDPIVSFLLVWPIFVLMFFSFSNSKLIPYILPAIPPVAIAIGIWADKVWHETNINSNLRISFIIISILFVVSGAMFPFIERQKLQTEPSHILIFFKWFLILAGSNMLFNGIRRKNNKFLLSSIAINTIALLSFINPVAKHFQREGTHEIALSIYRHGLSPEDHVFCAYDYFQDLPVYLNRTVGIIAHMPNEQLFGFKLEDHSKRYLSLDEFVKFLQKRKDDSYESISRVVYVVLRLQDFDDFFYNVKDIKFTILKKTKNFVLVRFP